MSDECTAELIDQGMRFRLTRGAWFNEYAIGELDGWIAFYRKNRAESPKALHHYDATINALEALAAQITRGSGTPS